MNNKSSRRILIVTLNPALDKTFVIPNFKTAQAYLTSNETISAGGKGLNMARGLKTLGFPSLNIGFCGGCNGHIVKEQLLKEKIIAEFTGIKGETRMNLTVLEPIGRTTTRILEEGPLISHKEIRQFKNKFVRQLKCCSMVVLAGRKANNLSDQIYAELIQMAQFRQVDTFLDTSGAPLKSALKAVPTILKVNVDEAAQTLNMKLATRADHKKAIANFHNMGIKVVLITMAECGAIGSDATGIYFIQPPRIEMINSVGSGDAFGAGFIAASLRKYPLKDALRFAVAAGTANAVSIIPGTIDQKAMRKILKKVRIRQIR